MIARGRNLVVTANDFAEEDAIRRRVAPAPGSPPPSPYGPRRRHSGLGPQITEQITKANGTSLFNPDRANSSAA